MGRDSLIWNYGYSKTWGKVNNYVSSICILESKTQRIITTERQNCRVYRSFTSSFQSVGWYSWWFRIWVHRSSMSTILGFWYIWIALRYRNDSFISYKSGWYDLYYAVCKKDDAEETGFDIENRTDDGHDAYKEATRVFLRSLQIIFMKLSMKVDSKLKKRKGKVRTKLQIRLGDNVSRVIYWTILTEKVFSMQNLM